MAQTTNPRPIELDLTPAELDAIGAHDLASFVQLMYPEVRAGEQLIWGTYLDLLCAKLEDVAHGRIRNLIITLPPRHLKSFCVSVCLPAYVLGHYPSQQIMCVSYGQDLAKDHAQLSLKVITSETYRALFGDILSSPRQALQQVRTAAGGVRRATSIEGTATGVGADLMIFDDPQRPTETISDAIRCATNDAYEQTFLSRLNKPDEARTIIVMQRLHEDDFVGHVLELGGEWEMINLPVIAEEDQAIAYTNFLGDHIYLRREGQALHPARLSLDALAIIRRAAGEAVWATQYQQRPVPMGGGLLRTAWFPRYRPGELPDRFDQVIQSWDTASTDGAMSAYSVCTTWGIKGKHIYLLHVFRERLIYPDLKRAVICQAALHDAEIVYVEDHASGTQLLQELPQENIGYLRGVKPTGDKVTRMINQTALIENGFVHLPEAAPWLEDYLHELELFPKPKYFDQIDSTSQALAAINRPINAAGWLAFAEQAMRDVGDQPRRRLRDPEKPWRGFDA